MKSLKAYLIEAVTEYDERHRKAQYNAALPIESGGLGLHKDNTSLDRAKAMGFDINKPVYHGTGADIKEFQSNRRGVHFTTPSHEFANKYAGSDYSVEVGASPNILPTFVKSQNPFDYENKASIKKLAYNASLGKLAIDQIKKGDWSRIEDRTTLAAIKDLGFDGVYVNENGVKNFATFDPKNIRSRFAAFDPKRQHESDLLA